MRDGCAGPTGLRGPEFRQGAYLLGAAESARTVMANPFIDRGLGGPAIGRAMREERLRAFNKY